MFLLVTGASGIGKSTVRRLLAAEFKGQLECTELVEVAGPPEWSLRWRHQAVEAAVRRALHLQREGKHFLLCGDPVAPAELYSVPSADQLERTAVCLLDASEEAQRSRLIARGDPADLIPHHVAFAAWLREQGHRPAHRLDVIQHQGWDQMQWQRWTHPTHPDRTWRIHRVDTTGLGPERVAALVASWIREELYR